MVPYWETHPAPDTQPSLPREKAIAAEKAEHSHSSVEAAITLWRFNTHKCVPSKSNGAPPPMVFRIWKQLLEFQENRVHAHVQTVLVDTRPFSFPREKGLGTRLWLSLLLLELLTTLSGAMLPFGS